jgi:hypothetical protein
MTTLSASHDDLWPFEEILACSIRDVVFDLCLADADIILSYVANKLHGNLNELVMSSTELFFKEKTLSYARASGLEYEWGHPASITIDLEFAHGPLSVLFQLVLGSSDIGVRINRMDLGNDEGAEDFDVSDFAHLLHSARLTPPPGHNMPKADLPSQTRH